LATNVSQLLGPPFVHSSAAERVDANSFFAFAGLQLPSALAGPLLN